MFENEDPIEDDTPSKEEAEPSEAPSFAPITSQEQLDRVLSARLRREREKFADYGKLKEAAAKLADIERANMSEQDKLKAEAEEAKARAESAFARIKTKALEASVYAEAAKVGVVDPDVLLALVERSGINFDEDGEPQNVAKVVSDILKAKPYLKGTRGNIPTGPQNSSPDKNDPEYLGSLSMEDYVRLRNQKKS